MKTPIHSDKRTASRQLTVPEPNRQLKERAERLRAAVHSAGGNKAVAHRSRVPLGTLNTYLSGGEIKLTAAVALAEACGITLGWLATGEESDARVSQSATSGTCPAGLPSSNPAESRLFNIVNIDKLSAAMETVIGHLPPKGGPLPVREILQTSLLLYDIMGDGEGNVDDVSKAGKSVRETTKP